MEHQIDWVESVQDPEARAMAALLAYGSEDFQLTALTRMQEVGELIKEYWAELARASSPYGDKYASTLVLETDRDGVTVRVDESHANAMFVDMVENGIKPYSIKDRLLAGRRAQKNKALTGKLFVVVPFRWRTPSKNRQTAGFTGTISQDAYRLVKDGGKITKKQATDLGNKNLSGLSKRPGGYFTFRTVTPRSRGFIHPGKPPSPVFKQVVEEAENVVEASMLALIEIFKEEARKLL